MRHFTLIILSLFIINIASPALAYPPKAQDWVMLGDNNKELINAYMQFGENVKISDSLESLKDIQEQFTAQMGGVNAACKKIRDQIGTGGLFGPDMWTQGFSQTCWALASFQKASNHSFNEKICSETKAAINFFKAFRPKKWPADYPQAEADMAKFVVINNTLREIMFTAGDKKCKPIEY